MPLPSQALSVKGPFQRVKKAENKRKFLDQLELFFKDFLYLKRDKNSAIGM
jgi:hypothetical protein